MTEPKTTGEIKSETIPEEIKTEQANTPTFWAAPDLAKAGYPVFPVNREKHPTVKGGFYAATTDPSEIAAWIEEGKGGHDIGVATGSGSGFVVIEADTPETYASMEAQFGEPHVKSKRGGHWYFKHPKDGKVVSRKISEGLDSKGDGGLVIAPPSTNKSWTNNIPDKNKLPDLPPALRDKVRSGITDSNDHERNGQPPQVGKLAGLEAAAVIARHVSGLEQGDRHAHLKHMCGALLPRIAAADVETILAAAWNFVGGELAERAPREVPNTIRTTTNALADENATGVPSMEKLTPGLFDELERIFGWGEVFSAENDDSDYSHHTDGGFGENKTSNESDLPIKTVDEVITEAGESVDWIIEDILARGALTEFSGLAKKGGKTTFWCHAITAGAKGEDHAGFTTTPAKYLYLTEQGNNFADALRESGLVDHAEHISVIQFKDVSARGWHKLIKQAGAAAKRRGFDALIIDTFAVFAGLKGSEENDAGPVADRMRTLRLTAQKYNLGAGLIRHSGKDGTPRGSSAFEAEADICITLSRPEGRHAPNVRHIAGIGRYGEWERNIQLVDGHYISLGTDSKIEFNKAVRHIRAVLSEGEENGKKKQYIMDSLSGPDKDEISASTIDRALSWLVKKEAVGEKELTHSRGRPKVYWLLPEVYFHQTPSPNGGNKPQGDHHPSSDHDDHLGGDDHLSSAAPAKQNAVQEAF